MAILTSRLILSLVDRVSGPARAIQSSLAGLTGVGGTAGIGAAMASQMATIRRSAATASGTIAAPLALIGTSGFRAAYGLEKVMNNVQAVGMLSDEQRGKLKGYIQELNTSFPFINKEIGEAAFELFRAGFGFEQAMGALKGTLLLAQAGDIGRQEAADIATNVLTAMRLPMQTTEQAASSMALVNDTLSYAANKSNTDVRLLGETFKYVAPLASAAGMSIAQVAAAAMTMANNGIKGSEAGVAMRAAIVRMAKPTKDMMATLDRLKINLGTFITGGRTISGGDIVTGLLSSGIDASKHKKAIEAMLKDKVLALKPGQLTANLVDLIAKDAEGAADKNVLAETIGNILTAGGKNYDLLGFTRALRDKGVGVAEIARIMDVRQGARVLTLLLDDVEAKAREVETKSLGAAQRMADIRMKGIVGEVARLAAAWENLWVTIGDAGVLTTIGKGFDAIAEGLKSIAKASPLTLQIGTYALTALAVIGPLGLLLQGVGATMVMLAASARLAGLAVLFLGRSLLITAPAAAWAGLVGTFGALAAAARVARGAVLGLAVATMLVGPGGVARIAGGAALAGVASIVTRFGAALARIAVIGGTVTGVLGALAAAGLFVYQNWQGLGSFFTGFADGFMKGLGPARPVIEGIATGLGSLFDWLIRLTGPLDESGVKWRSWGETVGGAIAWPIRKLAEMAAWMARIGLALRDSAVGRLVFGKRAETEPAAPAAPPLPGAKTAEALKTVTAPTTTSVPATGARTKTGGDLAAVEAQARTTPAAVSQAMGEVRAIVASVDLTAEGKRIGDSLANGIRQSVGAIRAAAQEAAAAATRGAMRGAYSDGGR